jgi:hypothetical protein
MSSPISSSMVPTARSPEPDNSGLTGRTIDLPCSDVREIWHRSFGPSRKARAVVFLRHALFSWALSTILIAATSHAQADDLNDYPTSARADYVFGCMKANGETQEILQRCSCSIDVIASIIPYDRYVSTETILSMSQVTGPVGSEFRSTEPARLAVQEFRRAQAEAEVRCF